MGFIKGDNREQHILFPGTIDEFVSSDNPVRVIAAFVDSLDYETMGFRRATPAATGRRPYAPRDLLALYIYGYLNRIRSSRSLERETHRNVEVMWLLGRLTPDFKTIADFRRDNGPAIRQACREFTLLCKKLDLFGAELVAIDGSKFLAVNSRQRSFTQKRVRDVIAQIDGRIEEYLRRLNTTDREETNRSREDTRLAEKIAVLEERLAESRALLVQMEQTNANEISLTDGDARRMIVGPVTEVCYNAQLAVDDKHHLIVAEEVTNNPVDKEWLSAMALAANAVLEREGLEVVADKGYSSTNEIKTCLDHGIVPYVPRPHTSANRGRGLFTKDDFRYQPDQDVYVCPAGQKLTFRFQHVEKRRPIRYYATAACNGCPLRANCTRNKDGRRITRHAEEAVLEDTEARLRQRPDMLLRRKSVVEHVFGTMKHWLASRHWLTRGLEHVRTEFSLTALAYNLRRAMNILGVPALLQALG
jgi:transposase